MHSSRGAFGSLLMASLAAFVMIVGCPNTRDEGLIVNVQTDYAPAIEFDAVLVRLDEGAPRNIPVSARDRFSRPLFITTYTDAAPGRRVVAASLMRGTREVARRTVQLEFSGTYLVTVVLTRSCRGVECLDGQSCLGQRCIPNTCITGLEESCPRAQCASDAACTTTTACVRGECVAGVCLQQPNNGLCLSNEVCVPETGCVALPSEMDGGEDDASSIDAGGTDAGNFDAGITDSGAGDVTIAADAYDGMCRGASDCADAFVCTVDSCTSGVCGHDPSDVLCPGSACVPSDPLASPTTGCLPVCNASTCVADPCETARCVAGRCERTPTCVIGESCCSGTCALDCAADATLADDEIGRAHV